jgi:CRP-like cAMP-binding protein
MSRIAFIPSHRSSHLRIVSPQQALKGDLLRLKPDTFWKIEAGIVRSQTWDEEGRMMTLGFWGEGDIVGTPLSRIKPYQVECLTDVQVTELLPESSYLLEALLVHVWKTEEFFSIIHRPLITDRFLGLLEWLANQFGESTPEGILLNLRLTHQDFADTLGTSRVTITRLINQFEHEGKIARKGRLFKICLNLL